MKIVREKKNPSIIFLLNSEIHHFDHKIISFFNSRATTKMKFTLTTIATLAATATAFTPSSFVQTTPVSHRAVSDSATALCMKYKVAVVGGGPSGACAAEIFAQEKNIETFMFERKLDNAKPCGGAIPLCMIGEFNLPETVVDRKVGFMFINIHLKMLCFHRIGWNLFYLFETI